MVSDMTHSSLNSVIIPTPWNYSSMADYPVFTEFALSLKEGFSWILKTLYHLASNTTTAASGSYSFVAND